MEQCISLIMQELQRRRISNHHTLAYQSRVGPVQWLQPYTDVTIRYAPHCDTALQQAGDPAGDGKLGSWGLFCGVAAVLVDVHSSPLSVHVISRVLDIYWQAPCWDTAVIACKAHFQLSSVLSLCTQERPCDTTREYYCIRSSALGRLFSRFLSSSV